MKPAFHKSVFGILIILIGIPFNVYAQTLDTNQSFKLYKTIVYLDSNASKDEVFKGVLYEYRDTNILIASSFKLNDYQSQNYDLQSFSYDDIYRITVYKKNTIGRGALIGGLATISAFAIMGGIQDDVLLFVVGSIFFTPWGVVIGVATSTSIAGREIKFRRSPDISLKDQEYLIKRSLIEQNRKLQEQETD